MRIISSFLFSLIMSSALYAADFDIVGTVDVTLKHADVKKSIKSVSPRHIKLIDWQLSKTSLATVMKRAEKTREIQFAATAVAENGQSVQLGMANVPVLDQGAHGSCVTFAVTAAIDAAMNKGDYISQLCQLQLGRYMERAGYGVSGWDGSLGRFVLSQMEVFGIVSKANEKSYGCGGLTAYPMTYQTSLGSEMNPEQYHELSEDLNQSNIFASTILDVYEALHVRQSTAQALLDVKRALKEGDRVVFASLLADPMQGVAGAVGRYHEIEDSWVLTEDLINAVSEENFAGHEMVITGFDDNAIAYDKAGHAHKGLLTLRNSWGAQIGDKGNFYMSYDYFKALAIEAHRIRKE